MGLTVLFQKFLSSLHLPCPSEPSNYVMAKPGRIREMWHMVVGYSIVIGLCLGSSALAGATPLTLTVTSLADSSGSCTGAGSSLNCSTLRSAILEANTAAGSTIQFQSGVTGTVFLGSVLPTISQSVTIAGPGANSLTISGIYAYQILNISAGTVTISGLAFANGTAHGSDAGAIFDGGSGALTLMNSTFSGNNGNYGGAVTTFGATTVTNCTFFGNTAENGGGAINSNAALVVTNSTFSGNSTTAPYNPNNGGYGGGAILSFGSVLTVTNSTFSGNSSAGWGGALFPNSGTLTANNDIFVGNTVLNSSRGAGIAGLAGTSNGSYDLFYQNVDANGTEDDCDGCTSNTNAITGSNPNLFPMGYYGGSTETLLPQPGSPAICAGSSADVPNGVTTDQRGFVLSNSSCSNGGVDVGAVQSDYIQVTNTTDSGAGSLRAAIIAAATNDGGEISFANGVTGTITLGSALPAISHSMVIVGPGAGNLTVSGNNSYQIFNISSTSTMFLSGLTLANGNSNAASTGGGAIENAGTLTVIDSIFTGSLSNGVGGNEGGAIENVGTLAATNCSFSGNSAASGGAINAYGTTTITGSIFSGNIGPSGGGAVINDGTTTVINSTFSGNSANSSSGDFGGGAIESFGGTLTVINSTFSGNFTSSRGGAIDSFNGATLMAYNNIFTGNSSGLPSSGAGIVDLGGTVNASYSLYYQNLDAGATEDDCNSCTSNTNAITGADPLLAALGNYGGPTQSMLPAPGSPAICGGTTGLIPSGVTTDQRGFSRTTSYGGTACADLGAVQTDYTAVMLSASSYSGLVSQNVTPAPVVTVTENGQNIGGVPITLGYSGTGSPTGLGPITTAGGTGATFSGLTASAPAQGTLSVDLPITASGNNVQPAALTAYATLNIHSTAQTIVFAAPSAQTYGNAPIALTATGGDSGNPVIFSLDPTSTPGSASLSGSTLTILGVGTVVIDANQAAGGGYVAAAQVQQSIAINPALLTITASSLIVTYGSALPAIAPIFGAFLNGDSSAVLAKQPTCVTAYTTASAAGSSPSTSCSGAMAANYAFAYVNGSVTVNKATPTISVTPSSSSISTVQALAVAVAVGGGNAANAPTGSVTLIGGGYSSGALALANGNATINIPAGSLAVGNDTLTVSYTPDVAGSVNYDSTSGSSSISVSPAPTFVLGGGGSSSISITPGATTGNTVPITVTPSNGFTGTVNLTCSISPVAANDPPTCSLSPASVTITGTGAQTSTLSISTTAPTVSEKRVKGLLWPSAGTALALVLLIGVPLRRRGWMTLLVVLGLSLAFSAIGCGGSGGSSSSGGGGGENLGTTPGTYSITVTGTSGGTTGVVGTFSLTVQ